MPRHLIAIEGPLKGKTLIFKDGKEKWIIGRDNKKADFFLNDPAVSRRHAECLLRPDGIAIKDLSHTNPILVNDQALFDEVLLQEGDRVKIGDNIFLYSEEEVLGKEEKISEEPLEDVGVETIFLEETNKEPTHIETIFEEDSAPILKEEKKEESHYDTIFEDLEPSESPVYPSLEEPKLILKVVAGPNTGAEFSLQKDHGYLIGKDPTTCDITFNDLSVSRHHASLKIDEKKEMILEDLNSKNHSFVNGQKVEGKIKILPQDFISLGTTTFVVLDKDVEIETIIAPVEEIKKTEIEKVDEVKKEKTWADQVIPYRHLWIGGSFILILLISIMSFFALFSPSHVVIEGKDISKKISESLTKYDGVEFSYNPKSESLFLTGHVLTSIEKQEMLYSLKQISEVSLIDDYVIIDELVWKSINGLLSDNKFWRGASIHSSSAGRFVLSGYIQTTDQSEALLDYLNVHFPYVDRLENKLVIEDILKVEIRSLLIKEGFDGISFALTTGDVILTGQYNQNNQKKYEEFIQKLKTFPGVRAINNVAIASSADSARIDLTSKYIITGFAKMDGKNFGVLINGKIVTAGDVLDQMIVTEIKSNLILLEKDDIKYKINFSQSNKR